MRKSTATDGWDPPSAAPAGGTRSVATWVFVAESDLNRRQVARHNVMLRNAFPLDGHFVRRWLRDPSAGSVLSRVHGALTAPSRVDGLSFLAYAAGGDTNGRRPHQARQPTASDPWGGVTTPQ